MGNLQDVTYGNYSPEVNFFENIGATSCDTLSKIFKANGENKIGHFTDESRMSYLSNLAKAKSFKFEDWSYEEEKRIISYEDFNSSSLYEKIRDILKIDNNPKNEEEYKHILTDLQKMPEHQKDYTEFKSKVSKTSLDTCHKDNIIKYINDIIYKNTYIDYDYKNLKGVIFGIKTSFKDKEKIKAIINEKLQKENIENNDFKFYQAYHSHVDNKIHKIYEEENPESLMRYSRLKIK